MGFIDKFEMLDPLTKDDLQTFVGRERDSGRAVLIHLIPRGNGLCSEYGLAQILLRYMADGKSGPIIDAGDSPDASRYYVVTEMPVDAALQHSWLGSYRKARGEAPKSNSPQAGLSHNIAPAAPPAEPKTANYPEASKSANAGSSATNLVNGVAKDGLNSVTPPSPALSSESGEFTKLWHGFQLGEEPLGVERKASPLKPAGAKSPDLGNRPVQGQSSATQSFGAKGIPESPRSEQNGDSGSFTRMFQSPSVDANSSKEDVGAFTKFFSSPETAKAGAADSRAANPAPFPGDSSPFGASAGTTPHDESRAFSMLLKPPTNHLDSSAPSRPADDRLPNAWAAPIEPGDAGATRLFAVPKPPVTGEPAPASGPSDFTRVVAAPPAHRVEPSSTASSAASSNRTLPPVQVSAAAPSLNMPQPAMPGSLPTPVVNAPFGLPTPALQSPVVPAIPSMPTPGGGGSVMAQAKMPAIQPAAQGPAGTIPRNFLYLVLSMNLLFAIAVLLIVYFVVKH